MSASLSQLRMVFTRFEELVPPQLPSAYSLRTFRPGDERAWIALLASGEFGHWDRPRLERMLAGERAPLPHEGIFFVTHQDRPVGTACIFLHSAEYDCLAELGWFTVHPLHRGHGLGLQLCRAVLGFISGLSHQYAYLLTEDFRLPAISTYLRLGFEPEMSDPSHPGRWEALQRILLGEEGIRHRPSGRAKGSGPECV